MLQKSLGGWDWEGTRTKENFKANRTDYSCIEFLKYQLNSILENLHENNSYGFIQIAPLHKFASLLELTHFFQSSQQTTGLRGWGLFCFSQAFVVHGFSKPQFWLNRVPELLFWKCLSVLFSEKQGVSFMHCSSWERCVGWITQPHVELFSPNMQKLPTHHRKGHIKLLSIKI